VLHGYVLHLGCEAHKCTAIYYTWVVKPSARLFVTFGLSTAMFRCLCVLCCWLLAFVVVWFCVVSCLLFVFVVLVVVVCCCLVVCLLLVVVCLCCLSAVVCHQLLLFSFMLCLGCVCLLCCCVLSCVVVWLC